MMSFIILSSNDYMRDLYKKVVIRFLYTSHDYYDIYEFSEFNLKTWASIKQIEGKRIYLIDKELKGADGFDVARKIRDTGDVLSPIIAFNEIHKRYSLKSIKNTMILNVIEQNGRLIHELLESLEKAYTISTKHSTLSFSSFDEIYRLPYDDIYYIEKTINDDTLTIYTKDDSYIHYKSIKKLADKLKDDPRFMRCHRSCIINIFKVASYDCKDNIVIFDNGMTTDLVSKERRKPLKDRLIKEMISE